MILKKILFIITRLKMNKDFNENGLRFSVDFLQSILPILYLFEPKHQAIFVDAVTYERVESKFPFGLDLPEEIHVNHINTTAVGNIAYISLHHCDEVIREHASKVLTLINEKLKEKYGKRK